MIEGEIYSEVYILEREGKREEKKIILAYWRAGHQGKNTQDRAESHHDFELWRWLSQEGLALLPVSGNLS